MADSDLRIQISPRVPQLMYGREVSPNSIIIILDEGHSTSIRIPIVTQRGNHHELEERYKFPSIDVMEM